MHYCFVTFPINAESPFPVYLQPLSLSRASLTVLRQSIMAAIKVHGSVLSTAAQRVIVTLYEKDLEFEFVSVDMKAGEHKTDHFLALNPFGQVPAFEHGDLKLFESRAITRYIAHEFADKGTNLICQGKEMAKLSVWMEVEAHQFDPVASKLNWELVFKPMFGMTTDTAVVQENEEKLAKVLDVYEAQLAKSKYIACGCLTLADLHHLPNIQCLLGTTCKQLFESRPRVNAWVADITARPSWSKVVASKP
ncbi:hypothetical protein K2173_026263 [Erythroxylum novogranatense]|uniref:glutathione transferase n=1 Tax=Erythroxylum novogranatense TaxID=1862640 RepID=A0AAV8SC34_9ROSI|nr:hypothetical protein K2173_026263 [Erythroxylum novogranatense]